MDNELNNINEFLVEQESSLFPIVNVQRHIRKSSLDYKPPEYLISPINNSFNFNTLGLHSPSPNKPNLNFYDQDHSYSQENGEFSHFQHHRKCISNVINFEDSPKIRISQSNTAASLKTTYKIPYEFSLGDTREEKRNTKGLRNLSESVYKIVLELQVTTYKEVAEHLVRLFNCGQFASQEEQNSKARDQQNIKRRVYDALNVLISADVLKKNAKFVISDQEIYTQQMKVPIKGIKKQDAGNLSQQIRKKQKIIAEKKQKIEQLKNKKQILNVILKRNKKKKVLQKQKIFFPIVGITSINPTVSIQTNQQNSVVLLPLEQIVDISGDMDLLMKAGIDILNQNIQEIIQQVSEEEVDQDELDRKVKISVQNKPKVAKLLYSL